MYSEDPFSDLYARIEGLSAAHIFVMQRLMDLTELNTELLARMKIQNDFLSQLLEHQR